MSTTLARHRAQIEQAQRRTAVLLASEAPSPPPPLPPSGVARSARLPRGGALTARESVRGLDERLRAGPHGARAPPPVAARETDISYRQDAMPPAHARGMTTALLFGESRMPPPKHASTLLPVLSPQPADGQWDSASGQWGLRQSPTAKPSGRREVELLRAALNEMVLAIASEHGVAAGATVRDLLRASGQGRADGPELTDRVFGQLHRVYATGAHELARQVGTQVAERGQLLAHVWDAHVELFEHALAAKDAQIAALTTRANAAERARDVALEQAEVVGAMEAVLATRSVELAEVAVSRDQLLALTRSLQLAVKRADAAAHRHQSEGREAEAVLSAWLPHWRHFHSAQALRTLQHARGRRLSAMGGTLGKGVPGESAQLRAQRWHHALERHVALASGAEARAQGGGAAAAADSDGGEHESVGLSAEAIELLLRDAADLLTAVMDRGSEDRAARGGAPSPSEAEER